MKRKILSLPIHIIFSLLILAFAVFVSFSVYGWSGFPKGWDNWGHVFRLLVVSEFWPHINWIHTWASGMPLFLWYPSLPYIILAGVLNLTQQSPEFILTAGAVGAVGLAAVGIYFLVNEVSKNKLASLLSAVLYLATPSVWSWTFASGLYGRVLAMAFLPFSLWFAVRWWKGFLAEEERKLDFFLAASFLSLTFLGHFLMGFAIAISILGMMVLTAKSMRVLFSGLPKLFLSSILLASFFLIPLFFGFEPHGFSRLGEIVDISAQKVSSFSDLVYWIRVENQNLEATNFESPNLILLNPFLIPLTLLLLLGLFIKRGRETFKVKAFADRLILTLLIFALGTIFYSMVAWRVFVDLYQGILVPVWALFFTPLYLAPFVGILLARVFPRRWLSSILSLGLIFLAGYWVSIQFPLDVPFPLFSQQTFVGAEGASLVDRVFKGKDYQFNFRFGDSDYQLLGSIFNKKYPYVPQTRDYYNQGILNPDYYFYLDYAGWLTDDNINEANFLFDWFAIKQFIVQKSKFKEKFNNPSFYKMIEEDESFIVYEFEGYSPVLAASDAPSVLIIGDKIAGDTIFRALAQANLNSQYLLPILGRSAFVEDYTLRELQKFDIVALYNYKVRNWDRAYGLLSKFVNQGGNLFLESSGSLEANQGKPLADPFPITAVGREGVEGDWQLELTEAGESYRLDLKQFSPPIFDDRPWGVATATGIKSWARPLLLQDGKPVVIAGSLGEGRVIWSGLNLPFHTMMYQSAEEAKFLGQLLWKEVKKIRPEVPTKDKDLVYETESFRTEFLNPEERVVTLKKNARGILFKECYFRNWHAYADGREVTIYKAGPAFMYVPLGGAKNVKQVTFKYRKSIWPETVSATTSLLSFLILLIYPLEGKLFKPFLHKIPDYILAKIKLVEGGMASWWEREEE